MKLILFLPNTKPDIFRNITYIFQNSNELAYWTYAGSCQFCKDNSRHAGRAEDSDDALNAHHDDRLRTFFTCRSGAVT